MAQKRKIFTKKNAFILFLLSCLTAATVIGVLHAKGATERLETANLQAITAQEQVIKLQGENIILKMILTAIASQERPTPVECAAPIACETCAEPVECIEPVECPAPVTCEPKVVTIRVVETEEVIKEIKVPVECSKQHIEPVSKLEGFTPYVDLLGQTDGTAGAKLGIDKEVINNGRLSLHLFAELSHDLIQKDAEGIELDPYYCQEFECIEIIDSSQRDRTRGNFGIRFRF